MSSLKKVSVLVVGDVMLDEYLYGTIDRISPEAPVGVLSWTSREACLGGAANVARNLAQLGYPGCHLLKLGERDADTRAFLAEQFKGSNASVVHADFDGDGYPDYALLLKSDTSAAAKLVVFLCDAQSKCRSVFEQDISGYSEGAYLSRLPVGSRVADAGSAEGEKESHPVTLTSTGIRVTYFEKGAVALYWEKKLKKIVAVGTGE